MTKRIIAAIIVFVFFIDLAVQPVKAAGPSNFLEDEAGIAAWFQFTGPTNLRSNLLRNLFRTIPQEGQNYLIGFMPIEGLESYNNQDLKVFVHTSGWAVAYYQNSDPSSKIFINSISPITRLERALQKVASAIEVTDYTINYHHFGFPDATRLAIIQMNPGAGSKTIDFRLPGTNTYYERSFYAYALQLFASGELIIDGKTVSVVRSSAEYKAIGEADMVTNAKHVATFRGALAGAYFALMFVFSGPDSLPVNYADSLMYIDMPALPAELGAAAAEVPFYVETYVPLVWR